MKAAEMMALLEIQVVYVMQQADFLEGLKTPEALQEVIVEGGEDIEDLAEDKSHIIEEVKK